MIWDKQKIERFIPRRLDILIDTINVATETKHGMDGGKNIHKNPRDAAAMTGFRPIRSDNAPTKTEVKMDGMTRAAPRDARN
jgi:hypothetical protein